jgi:cellulose synthase/poly-beta-1,6-N-acetylglucosamine synthase-like glycosyltransferase
VIAIHLAYPLLLKRLARKATILMPNDNSGDEYLSTEFPKVSILIPVYNEESVIENRINNIFQSNYPKDKIEIIVIDSGSDDKTRLIIQSKFQDKVTLITEVVRSGKAHAINLGLQSARGDIIILTDGTTLYDKETILQLIKPFSDETIGAVSAFYDVPNSEDSHVTASERKFWIFKDKLRLLESIVESTSWLSGEACAFRNKFKVKIHEDTLADDSNIALQLISKGQRVVVNKNARFRERSPTEFSDYIKIKSRRALGGLLETLRFKSLLFNRKYGYFGMIIFPYRFFVCLLSPILSCMLLGLAFLTIFELVSTTGFFSLALLGIGLILIVILCKDLFSTFFYTQLITIIALFWLVGGKKDVRWTRSNTR